MTLKGFIYLDYSLSGSNFSLELYNNNFISNMLLFFRYVYFKCERRGFNLKAGGDLIKGVSLVWDMEI